jgi:hypothetical protein
MKKNRIKFILIFLLAIIIVSNTPPVQYFLLEQYEYQNKDGSFKYQEIPGQSLDFEVAQIRWNRFKSENPNNPNQTLYRTFSIKPWQFWEWWQFIVHNERYRLPYLKAEK